MMNLGEVRHYVCCLWRCWTIWWCSVRQDKGGIIYRPMCYT
jgi:hypothetical protein